MAPNSQFLKALYPFIVLSPHQQARFVSTLKPTIKKILNKKYKEESKIDKLFEIKYCLKVIEGINLYDFMKAFEMCLVLDVVIP